MPKDFKEFMIWNYNDVIYQLKDFVERWFSVISVHRIWVFEENLYCFEFILQEIK